MKGKNVKFEVPFKQEADKGSGLKYVKELEVVVQLDPETVAVSKDSMQRERESSFIKLDQDYFYEDRTRSGEEENVVGARKVLWQLQDLKKESFRPIMLWIHTQEKDEWLENGELVMLKDEEEYYCVPLADDFPISFSHKDVLRDPGFAELELWRWYPKTIVEEMKWERALEPRLDAIALILNLTPIEGGKKDAYSLKAQIVLETEGGGMYG